MVLCVIQIVCGRQQESNSPQHLSKMIYAILIYLLKFDCTPAFFRFHEVSTPCLDQHNHSLQHISQKLKIYMLINI